jgi:hypothetical protein
MTDNELLYQLSTVNRTQLNQPIVQPGCPHGCFALYETREEADGRKIEVYDWYPSQLYSDELKGGAIVRISKPDGLVQLTVNLHILNRSTSCVFGGDPKEDWVPSVETVANIIYTWVSVTSQYVDKEYQEVSAEAQRRACATIYKYGEEAYGSSLYTRSKTGQKIMEGKANQESFLTKEPKGQGTRLTFLI